MAQQADKLLSAADEDQVRMMEERVILTDYYDNPIGDGSKKDTHVWTTIQKGVLHRAFSVFLFTPEGKLVLQQRSPAKITFPEIWANTCCSHPLCVTGEVEMDDAAGVKRAARRKLEQELGIPPEDVPLDSFTWITRVHYVGSSAPETPGGAPFWGEHEIDWILMCAPDKMPRIALNQNEVAATRAFTQPELREWMATRHARGDEVSPWFGCMEACGLLYRWWDAVLARNLDTVLQRDVIHRQHDMEARAQGKPAGSVPLPPAFVACRATTHAGGVTGPLRPIACEPVGPKWSAAGGKASKRAPTNAGAPSGASAPVAQSGVPAAYVPGASAAVPKQGAYGKVRIHTESKLAQLSHLDEVAAAVAYKLGWGSMAKVATLPADASPELVYCEAMLCKVSRSFAMVIQQLPPHLRTCVCVFYLVLRGLDTVEDDMETFKADNSVKLAHLRKFHAYLDDPDFHMDGVGEGDERDLLEHFQAVNAVFAALPPLHREVIRDICARMGEGMALFSGRDLREGTADGTDYALYCHYVAGLVGEGLTRLWVASGDEDASMTERAGIKLADDMGLFLQKTNIIRDYLEDFVDHRAFWPKDIWGQYAPALGDFASLVKDGSGADVDTSLACLNHMVADALRLAPSCLRYMAGLHHPDVFRFCAIPQLMAIATLEKLVSNADVFTGVVKIRKGQALMIIMNAGSMPYVYTTFLRSARAILASIPPHHAAARAIAADAVAQVERICIDNLGPGGASLALSPLFSWRAVAAVCAVLITLLRHLYVRSRSDAWGDGADRFLPRITDSWDVAAVTGAVACVAYLFAYAGVPFVAGMGATVTPPGSPKAARKTLDADADDLSEAMSTAADVPSQDATAEAETPRRSTRQRPKRV